ncbi:copper amine oxidase N-terminal domain-containing protein [Paenibacillus sp. UNC499MF]|uniref:copper amine oxidase N-terminal domain-containing protein n=1 Tax=Paenibacillus sp. UNC499MF TaxID=1502751 RepID=UPI00089FCDC5|nr:copper amine oxidase N-terminal domain-containing protein [Paenibacillus sp. UNC499MF]SEG67141.1 Copper amine oxidase N-terminal domain-containing protein [Paenibacillus sp. UNC499MF]
MLKNRKWISAGLGLLILAAALPVNAGAASKESAPRALTLEQVAKEIRGKAPGLVYVEWKEISNLEDGKSNVVWNKSWEDAPNARFRLEVSYDTAGKTLNTIVINGDDGLSYMAEGNKTSKIKLNGMEFNSYSKLSKMRLETFLIDTEDPAYQGEETILGRQAYHLSGKSKKTVLKFTDQAGKEIETPVVMPAREQWYDTETGMLLKERAAKPSESGFETVVSAIKVSPELTPDVFDFKSITKKPEGIQVTINGQTQRFEQPPVIVEGNTLVPLRAIFEKLGANITWNEQEQSVTAVKGGSAIYLKIGSKSAAVNGESKILEVPAQLVNEHTMVPVRFISEALGADVKWEPSSQTVIITNP